MQPLSRSNTTKLFFDKYLYKVNVKTVFASEFRYKNLVRTLSNLNNYFKLIEDSKDGAIRLKRWHPVVADVSDAIHIKLVYDAIKDAENIGIRVEGDNLGIYSNNESLIDNIVKIGKVSEICKPANDKVKEFLIKTPNSVIIKQYTHKYRITVNPLKDASDSFHAWAEKIPTVKLLKRTYYGEGYFYAANEKTLSMCKLFLGGKIRRIDTLYTEDEIS